MEYYEPHNIKGKPVYVVQDHHYVLLPWALERHKRDSAPYLLTFDFHTDCHSPFQSISYPQNAEEILDKMDYRDPDSVKQVIGHLSHDEHIDTAIRKGVIAGAFVLYYGSADSSLLESAEFDPSMMIRMVEENEEFRNRLITLAENDADSISSTEDSDNGADQDGEDQADDTGASSVMSDRRIFIVPLEGGLPGGHQMSGRSPDDRHIWDRALESDFLRERLEAVTQMTRACGLPDGLKFPYILDIDLDYFGTTKSIQPDDAEVFYDLVRGALAITIATEPGHVESDKVSDEPIDAEILLENIMRHIEQALS